VGAHLIDDGEDVIDSGVIFRLRSKLNENLSEVLEELILLLLSYDSLVSHVLGDVSYVGAWLLSEVVLSRSDEVLEHIEDSD